MNAFLASNAPYALSLLRIIQGFLIIWHGSQKLFNYPPSDHPAAGWGLAAGYFEFFCGLLVMVGLGTRWAAFLLSGTMAVAYFMVHASNGKGFLPFSNGGELAVIYCFVFFYLWFAGGGPLSVDALISRRPSTNNE
jgi:putative oxidoreductase